MIHPPPRTLTRLGVGIGVVAVVLALSASTSPADAQQPEPYRDPPFTCEVIDYGSDPPPIPGPADDPLCVRYDKTNASVADLQALDFLAAEPGRVLLIGVPPRCAYWQQDHWVVSLDPSLPPLVSWRGSYWYDVSTLGGAAVMRDLRVAGVPVAADAFVEAIAPLIGPEQAEALRAFTDPGGGGGFSFVLPEGLGLGCRTDAAPSDEPSDPPPAVAPPPVDGAVSVESTSDARSATPSTLPATGATSTPTLPTALLTASLLIHTARSRLLRQ